MIRKACRGIHTIRQEIDDLLHRLLHRLLSAAEYAVPVQKRTGKPHRIHKDPVPVLVFPVGEAARLIDRIYKAVNSQLLDRLPVPLTVLRMNDPVVPACCPVILINVQQSLPRQQIVQPQDRASSAKPSVIKGFQHQIDHHCPCLLPLHLLSAMPQACCQQPCRPEDRILRRGLPSEHIFPEQILHPFPAVPHAICQQILTGCLYQCMFIQFLHLHPCYLLFPALCRTSFHRYLNSSVFLKKRKKAVL